MMWRGAEAEAARITVVDPEPRPADLRFPDDSSFAAPGHVEVRDFVVTGIRWGLTPLSSEYVAVIDNSVRPRVVVDASKRFKTFIDLVKAGKDNTKTFLVHSNILRAAREWDKGTKDRAARKRDSRKSK